MTEAWVPALLSSPAVSPLPPTSPPPTPAAARGGPSPPTSSSATASAGSPPLLVQPAACLRLQEGGARSQTCPPLLPWGPTPGLGLSLRAGVVGATRDYGNSWRGPEKVLVQTPAGAALTHPPPLLLCRLPDKAALCGPRGRLEICPRSCDLA